MGGGGVSRRREKRKDQGILPYPWENWGVHGSPRGNRFVLSNSTDRTKLNLTTSTRLRASLPDCLLIKEIV